MRNTLFKVLVCFVLALNGAKTLGQSLHPDSVVVKYEHFLTTTTESVACHYFTSAFKNTFRVKRIRNAEFASKLYSAINTSPKVAGSLDVRGMVTFYYKTKQVSYCFDRFGHFQKGDTILYSKSALGMLKQQINFL